MIEERRIKISEAARLLDRSPATLRSWERKRSMPASLRPKRDPSGDRYWTPGLIEEIRRWIEDNHFHPGSSLRYSPTPEQTRRHVERIREAARARRVNGHDPVGDLEAKVREAIYDLGRSPDDVVRALPLVAAGMGVSLGDAVAVVAQVIAERD